MRKEISSEDYDKAVRIAKSNEPKVISTTLSSVLIEPDSFDKKFIVLIMPDASKHKLTVAPSFFKQLAKILNVNLTMRRKMSDEKEDNKTFSELLNVLRQVQNSVAPIQVTLLFDVIDKQISHIKAGNYARLSNSALFGFAEGLVDKYPQLSISNVDAFNTSPNVNIQIVSGNIVDLTNKNISSDDESFQFGITLGNSGLTTSVGDFAYRLVCANGMMGIRTDERFHLKSTEEQGLLDLYKHFDKMNESNFIPEEFASNFENATQVHASYNEILNAYKFATKNLIVEFPEQESQLRYAFADKYFPAVREIQAKLTKKEIDQRELPEKAMQSIRTGMSMWELINTMTDLGSNTHPVYKVGNKRAFQEMGGKIMSADWDFEFEKFLLL